jgi:hypothetical protein
MRCVRIWCWQDTERAFVRVETMTSASGHAESRWTHTRTHTTPDTRDSCHQEFAEHESRRYDDWTDGQTLKSGKHKLLWHRYWEIHLFLDKLDLSS